MLFFLSLTLIYLFALGSFKFLLFVNSKSVDPKLRWLKIPARKSLSSAVLLGGIPLSFTLLFANLTLLNTYSFIYSGHDVTLFCVWIFSALVISVYGYLDDLSEIRPIAKLVGQIASVSIFAFGVSLLVGSVYSPIVLVVYFVWGMGTVNGGNLLDGLDTITIKHTFVSFSAFFLIGFITNHASLMTMSSVGIISMLAFYHFNKYPSKIHLGEIGGSLLGSYLMFLSAISFLHMKTSGVEMWHALCLNLIPLIMTSFEVGVSFLRRILTNKAPFKGDRLHIHHLLSNKYRLGHSKAATLIALNLTLQMVISFYVAFVYDYNLGLMVGCFLKLAIDCAIGFKSWFGQQPLSQNSWIAFEGLKSRQIIVVDPVILDDFTFQIHYTNSAKTHELKQAA